MSFQLADGPDPNACALHMVTKYVSFRDSQGRNCTSKDPVNYNVCEGTCPVNQVSTHMRITSW